MNVRMRQFVGVGAFALCLSAAVPALAGPDWVEGGENDGNFLPDAGPLPMNAQPITGSGPVGSISGRLAGGAGLTEGAGGDFQDMYLLQIDDFGNFFIDSEQIPSATEGNFLFDTSLFLFTGPNHPLGAGIGLLANLEGPQSSFGGAILSGQTDDGTNPMLISGLSYYLAIAGDGTMPVDAQGNLIFDFGNFVSEVGGEISGADGPGGMNPIAGWVGQGMTGDYFIPQMFGVSAVPTPGAIAVFGMGALAGLRRRR